MKTHVTVIPSDGIISVDGEVLFLDGIKSETFHALQWHDGAGHVEPGDGLPNEELSTDDYAGRVAPFVALWEEEKARLEEEANRPPTDEELAAQAVAEARAQSSSILIARMQADMVQTGAFAAAEFATFARAGLFTDWAAGQTYAKGYRLAHKGIVYEVMQEEVTAIENQPPDAAGMLAVYRPLSVAPETGEEPDGSREHPFTFLYGMDVTKDSYYSYEGKLWLARLRLGAGHGRPVAVGRSKRGLSPGGCRNGPFSLQRIPAPAHAVTARARKHTGWDRCGNVNTIILRLADPHSPLHVL